jgi:hypothetical protein
MKRGVAQARLNLGMIGIDFEISEEQRLAARLVAAAIWFNGHKDGINLFERLRIVAFQNPSFSRGIVLIENA